MRPRSPVHVQAGGMAWFVRVCVFCELSLWSLVASRATLHPRPSSALFYLGTPALLHYYHPPNV